MFRIKMSKITSFIIAKFRLQPAQTKSSFHLKVTTLSQAEISSHILNRLRYSPNGLCFVGFDYFHTRVPIHFPSGSHKTVRCALLCKQHSIVCTDYKYNPKPVEIKQNRTINHGFVFIRPESASIRVAC